MSSTTDKVTKGSCICGALSYEYIGDPTMTVRSMYTMLLPNPYPLTLASTDLWKNSKSSMILSALPTSPSYNKHQKHD